MKKIILASSSPRRRELLKIIGINFEVRPSSWDEEGQKEKKIPPEELCKYYALEKARNVVLPEYDDCIVIGCDTIVVLNNEVLGKPADSREAGTMLSKLSNKTHTVYSGLAFINKKTKEEIIDFAATDVTFRELTEFEINSYIKTKEPFDKAGAYGIQGKGGLFIEKINGCYYNVVGFPITKVYKLLSQMGVNIWS